MPTVRDLKKEVERHRARLTDEKGSDEQRYLIHAPTGQRWRANSLHILPPLEWMRGVPEVTSGKSHAIQIGIDDMNYGLEPCPADCEDCADQAEF